MAAANQQQQLISQQLEHQELLKLIAQHFHHAGQQQHLQLRVGHMQHLPIAVPQAHEPQVASCHHDDQLPPPLDASSNSLRAQLATQHPFQQPQIPNHQQQQHLLSAGQQRANSANSSPASRAGQQQASQSEADQKQMQLQLQLQLQLQAHSKPEQSQLEQQATSAAQMHAHQQQQHHQLNQLNQLNQLHGHHLGNLLAGHDLRLMNALGFLSMQPCGPANPQLPPEGPGSLVGGPERARADSSLLLSLQQQYLIQAAAAAAASAASAAGPAHRQSEQAGGALNPFGVCLFGQSRSEERPRDDDDEEEGQQQPTAHQVGAPRAVTGAKGAGLRPRRHNPQIPKGEQTLKFSISTILGQQHQQQHQQRNRNGPLEPKEAASRSSGRRRAPRRRRASSSGSSSASGSELELLGVVESADEQEARPARAPKGRQEQQPDCNQEAQLRLSRSPSSASVICSPRSLSNQSPDERQSESAMLTTCNSNKPTPFANNLASPHQQQQQQHLHAGANLLATPTSSSSSSSSQLNSYLSQAMARSLAAAAAAACASVAGHTSQPASRAEQAHHQPLGYGLPASATPTSNADPRAMLGEAARVAHAPNIDPQQQPQAQPTFVSGPPAGHAHNGLGERAAAAAAAAAAAFPWTVAARGKPRRGMMRRAVFSDSQRVGLEKRFQLQKYISKPDRKKLAEKLGLRDSQVKIWFQNRRMKWRNSKERELLSAGGSREQTLPTRNNPNPDLSDVGETIKRLQQQQQQQQQQVQQPAGLNANGGGAGGGPSGSSSSSSNSSSCSTDAASQLAKTLSAPIGNVFNK